MNITSVFISALLLAPFVFCFTKSSCLCSDPSDCELPSSVNDTRKEFFAFVSATDSSDDVQKMLSFDIATTFGMFGYGTSEEQLQHWYHSILCPAHRNGVRVVLLVGFDNKAQLSNGTARQEWIEKQIELMETLSHDGVNFDVEATIEPWETKDIEGYYELVKDTKVALLKRNNRTQISLDTPPAPGCTWSRCYDYARLSKVVDFFFLMDYDMHEKVDPFACDASSNDGIINIGLGMEAFKIIAGKDKIVMGFPWYGRDFTCLNKGGDGDACYIGKPCSNSHSVEVNYDWIINKINLNETGPVHRNEELKNPYVDYIAPDGKRHQVWYDDPWSLGERYELAKRGGVKGVGTWTASSIDYSDTMQVKEMWEAIRKFF